MRVELRCLPWIRRFAAGLVLCLGLAVQPASALTIVTTFVGGEAPPESLVAGGGSLEHIVQTAAAYWERAIRDDGLIEIIYGWTDLGSSTLAYALGGMIAFNNAWFSWFMDPTPDDDNEWLSFNEYYSDLGAGLMNVGRVLFSATGAVSSRYDLFSLALHEIGHVLGFVQGTVFNERTADGYLELTPPRPFAGAQLPITMDGGGHLTLPRALMYPYFSQGQRKLPSEADILGVAEISGYSDLNLDPARVPEPLAAVLLGMAWCALVRSRGRHH